MTYCLLVQAGHSFYKIIVVNCFRLKDRQTPHSAPKTIRVMCHLIVLRVNRLQCVLTTYVLGVFDGCNFIKQNCFFLKNKCLIPTSAKRWYNVSFRPRHCQHLANVKFTLGRMSYKCLSNVEAMSSRITLSQFWLSGQNYVGPTLQNNVGPMYRGTLCQHWPNVVMLPGIWFKISKILSIKY